MMQQSLCLLRRLGDEANVIREGNSDKSTTLSVENDRTMWRLDAV